MKVTLIPKRKMTPSDVPYGETGIYYADVVEKKLMQVTQTTDLSAHVAATDPHTGYRLESADHTHQSTGLQAGTLDHGLALTGLTDNDHTQYILHSLATVVNDFLVASGSGAYVKKTLAETLTILGKAVASGLASLDGSSLVVQNPANATATPTASKIPIADGSGLLDGWVSLALKAPLASPQLTGTVNISGLTASQILATDGSKNLVSLAVVTYPSLAELAYVKGVTSALQTQLNGKAVTLAGTINEITYFSSASTISSLAVATYPSLTELSYVKGVTSALQTQLGLLAPLASPTFTGTVIIPTPFTIGAVSMTATGTELNYVAGVTSALQTQLGLKAPLASPTFTGTVTLPTVTLGGAFAAGGQAISNIGGMSFAADAQFYSTVDNAANYYRGGLLVAGGGPYIAMYGIAHASTGAFELNTPDAAGTAGITRLVISGKLATAVATCTNLTWTGLKLSGALDANGQALNNTPSILLTPSGAPATTEGNFYYDSTAHKLKVRVAAGWETVTSA